MSYNNAKTQLQIKNAWLQYSGLTHISLLVQTSHWLLTSSTVVLTVFSHSSLTNLNLVNSSPTKTTNDNRKIFS